MTYHEPVLLHESITGLNISETGTYVDVTFGGGGHSREILKHLQGGKLFGFDQDPDASANVPDDDQFTLINQNFKLLKRYLRFYGIKQVDGLLADLGVSSHQFDTAKRGFTFRADAELDMRMNQSGDRSAKTIINEYDHGDLARIFRLYGELRNAGRIASIIVEHRTNNAISSTGDLRNLMEQKLPQKHWHKQLAQIFQALRIEVNDEMSALRELLESSVEMIKPGGRLVVISYHSLEDRLVKNFIREGKLEGEAERDFYGNKLTPFTAITRKPVIPTDEEIDKNNRARSAKLRIAERTTHTP